MNRPTLCEHGLTEPEYEKAKQAAGQLTSAAIAGVYLVVLAAIWKAVTPSTIQFSFALTYAVVAFAMTAFVPTLLICQVLRNPFRRVLIAVIPAYGATLRFDKARRAFEEWSVRTRKDFWLSLSGLAFEHELAHLLSRMGFRAKVTPPSGDGGVDIVIDEPDGKILVQCKAHARPVGLAVARELSGTLHDFRARVGILASLSGFSVGVRQYAAGKAIVLLDLDTIVAMHSDLELESNAATHRSRIRDDARRPI